MKAIRVTMLVGLVCLLGVISVEGQSWDWAIKPVGRTATGGLHNNIVSVAIDHAGDAIIVGQFNDSATLGPFEMSAVNLLDMYIAKIDTAGMVQWVSTIGGPYENDQVFDVAVDPAGNAYMAGFFVDSADFDGIVVTQSLTSAVALAKYDADGNVVWARTAEGLLVGVQGGVAYSSTGHVYLASGHTLGKYTGDGDTVWTVTVPLVSNTFAFLDVVADASGENVYVSGYFGGPTNLGGIQLTTGGITDLDIVVAKFDEDGNAVWARQAGAEQTSWPEAGYGIDLDLSGNVYVCGQFADTADFSGDTVMTRSSLWSVFVAKYATNGDFQWVVAGSNPVSGVSTASDVRVVDNGAAVLVSLNFSQTLLFGGTDFSFPLGSDALLLKVTSSGVLDWGLQSGSAQGLITMGGMDVNADGSAAVLVGKYANLAINFGSTMLASPGAISTDGFIVRALTGAPTSVEERPGAGLPRHFALGQNYPNPFNPSTTIEFDIPSQAHVSIEIFNILGRHVHTLVDRTLGAGAYSIEWDGREADGSPAASGVYVYRLQTGDIAESRKMVLVK